MSGPWLRRDALGELWAFGPPVAATFLLLSSVNFGYLRVLRDAGTANIADYWSRAERHVLFHGGGPGGRFRCGCRRESAPRGAASADSPVSCRRSRSWTVWSVPSSRRRPKY